MFELSTENISSKTRKQELENARLSQEIDSIKEQINELGKEKECLIDKIERIEKSEKTGNDQRRKQRKDVTEALVKTNLQLKRQIEAMIRLENHK